MLLMTFVILIAAANLCLGFGAAVYLGMGPKTWPRVGLKRARVAHQEHSASVAAGHDHHSPAPVAPSPPKKATSEASADDEDPAPAPLATHPLAQVLQRLAQGFDLFEAELAQWDCRRRDETLDADGLTNSAIELNGLAAGYLDQLQAAVAPLAAQRLDHPAAITAREEVASITATLAQRLNVICAELGSLQFESSDSSLASGKLTTALMQVLELLHEMRDHLEEPLVALLGKSLQESALGASLEQNSQTSLLGRLCFEHLWQACETRRMSGLVGSMAMLDVDGLRQLNATHGPLVARQALLAIGEIACSTAGEDTMLVRLLGKQFLLVLPQLAPPEAAQTVEGIRQRIEQTHFRAGEAVLQLTVSAAVVVAQMDDTPERVLERLRATIREAKSYGRNRTFLWDDRAATPVVPPKLGIKPQTVAL